MPKKVRSQEQLLNDLKDHEAQKRKERKKCKNCGNSFYRKFNSTQNFPESAEFCGCKIKCRMVDPEGCCEAFL